MAVLPLAEKEKLEEAKRLEEENKKRQLCPAAPVVDVKIKLESAENENDNMYSVPVKQFLKRKYEESVAAKNKNDNGEGPELKRIKKENSTSSVKEDKKSIDETVNVISDSDSDAPPEEQPTLSKPLPTHNTKSLHKTKQNKNKKMKKKFMAAQSSNKPVHTNFDYKNVDFKKFQGGAQRAKGMEIKPQLHAKVN